MRARVCVLAVVVPRLMMDVKERSSFFVSLTGFVLFLPCLKNTASEHLYQTT
jgi:hypothetical protein